MLDKKNRINNEERAVLVGVVQKDQTEHEVQDYLSELAFLAETAGAIAVKKFIQKIAHPDSRTFVGKGKLEEIKNYCEGRDINLLIFDDELSGAQIMNIEKAVDVKTIDRSDLRLNWHSINTYYQGFVVCGNTLKDLEVVSVQEAQVKRKLKQTVV
jgi:GTP-binding protein HflX